MKTRNRSLLERIGAYIVILGCFVGMIYFFFFFDKKMKMAIEERASKISLMEKEKIKGQNNLEKSLEEVRQLNFKLDEKSEEIKKIGEFLPLLKVKYNFVNDVISLLKKHNLSEGKIVYEPEKPVSENILKFNEFIITMRVKGFYPDFKRFLWDLEHLEWNLKYKSFEIQRLSGEGQEMEVELGLITYFAG